MSTTDEDAETPADRAQAIRAFYESHPYPAPVTTLDQRLDRYRDPQRRRAQSLLLWPWRSRAPIEPSLSLAAARRRPRVMRSWSLTRA